MQLTRALSLVVALLGHGFGTAARADDSFVAKTQVYVDSDHTTVVSPLLAVSKDAWRGSTLGASYVADVVSSASVDVVSNATAHMNDVRSEVTGALTQKLRSTTLSGAYVFSTEHDYTSHNLALGLAQDLFQRNTTLAIGYSLALNDVGRVGDRAFHRSLDVHGVNTTWTQTLSHSTIGQLQYSFQYDQGYQASPYRFVRIESPDFSMIEFKVPETDPLERFRHAFVVGLNQHVRTASSLQGDYRLYLDSWGLIAHTVQLRYFVSWGDFTLRLRERFYYQKGADFFRSHYTRDALTPFVTADRELSTFWSSITGVKGTWRMPVLDRALTVEAKVDFFYFAYVDFALLSSRVGADLEAGFSLAF